MYATPGMPGRCQGRAERVDLSGHKQCRLGMADRRSTLHIMRVIFQSYRPSMRGWPSVTMGVIVRLGCDSLSCIAAVLASLHLGRRAVSYQVSSDCRTAGGFLDPKNGCAG
jgi:hypothetical protein